MESKELRTHLSQGGVIAFPITPFKTDLSVDLAGLRRNLERLIPYKLSAVIAAGGTGELYSLTPGEHKEVLRTTIEVLGKYVPVLAGVGFNYPLAIELAQESYRLGAQGLLAFPPYYPGAADEGLFEYYKGIGEATPLGMIIYSRDWANFSPGAVARLASLPTLAAWKDGQGDIRRYQMIMEAVGDRLYWIGGAGDDLVPAYYSIGIRTYTSSIANVAPELSLQLHELAAAGKREALNKLMERYVVPLYAFRTRGKGYEVSAMKAMMDEFGMAGGSVRPPLLNLSASDLDHLKGLLDPWRPLIR